MTSRNTMKWMVGLVAVAVIATAATAEAGFRHRHRSHGSSGGWGSSGGYGSSGGWGSSGGYGSSGGWGSSGGYGSSGGWGSSGGYGSSGGWGSSGGYGATIVPGTVIDSAPAVDGGSPPPPPADGSATPPPPPAGGASALPGGSTSVSRNAVLISVNVPADAKVFVNGNPTRSTGSSRQFISRGLQAGRQYTYELRAEVAVNGQTVTDTQVVQLTAGEQTKVAFNLAEKTEQNAAKSTKTKLTLNVPADAQVFLAGQETKSTGEHREFVSSKVAPGGKWDNYTVRVVANIDGQPVEKEQTITLVPGNDQELTFDFGTSDVALTASR